jgi:hypothetical protein
LFLTALLSAALLTALAGLLVRLLLLLAGASARRRPVGHLGRLAGFADRVDRTSNYSLSVTKNNAALGSNVPYPQCAQLATVRDATDVSNDMPG